MEDKIFAILQKNASIIDSIEFFLLTPQDLRLKTELYLEKDIISVLTWNQALKENDLREWDEALTAMHNELSKMEYMGLGKKISWNQAVDLAKPEIEAIVSNKIPKILKIQGVKKRAEKVINTIKWILLHWMLEEIYSDEIIKNNADEMNKKYEYPFRRCFVWIKAGRFPCGWRGKYPEGNLVVF